jgi:hypothetical protein
MSSNDMQCIIMKNCIATSSCGYTCPELREQQVHVRIRTVYSLRYCHPTQVRQIFKAQGYYQHMAVCNTH